MIAPTFRSRLGQPSSLRPMPGATESSTVEWHSAQVTPTRVTHQFDSLDRDFAIPRQEKAEWKGADGTTIVGYGIRNGNTEAFVAVVPPEPADPQAIRARIAALRQRLNRTAQQFA